uniref:Uncharacterized protein n=1 Tax=Arundo donax TaxID=35708 RepID=A0A0A9H429_ARUDO
MVYFGNKLMLTRLIKIDSTCIIKNINGHLIN